jgi:hypothetical protein
MSVDLNAYLNPVAHIEDIVTVAGLLFGCKKVIKDNSSENIPPFISINGSSIAIPLLIPTTKDQETMNPYYQSFSNMLSIKLINPFDTMHLSLHLDVNSYGQKLLIMRSTVLNVALASKLVEIFGGRFIPKDSMKDICQISEGTFLPFFVDDGNEGFLQKHEFFNSIYPISASDILQANNICGYTAEEGELPLLISQFSQLHADLLDSKLPSKINEKHSKIKL